MTLGWDTEDVPCRLCRSGEHLPLLDRDRYGLKIRTVVCRYCGLVYVSPRPTPAMLDRFYQRYYRIFYEGVSSPDASYVTRSDDDGRAAKRLQIFREFMPSSGTVMEIGCGSGHFLARVKEFSPGSRVVGFEPNPWFSAFARRRSGVVVNNSMEARAADDQDPIRSVAIFHVLEHCAEPRSLLEVIRGCLCPGGTLLLEVPDILGNWRGIGMFHLAHLYYFEEWTLLALLRSCGFRPVFVTHDTGSPSSIAVAAERLEAPDEPAILSSNLRRGEVIRQELRSRIASGPGPGWRNRSKGLALTLLGFENYRRTRQRLHKLAGGAGGQIAAR
jgi:SAM-dependent methyltransferase